MTGDTRSVRELAQSYLRLIKQVQRHGPYFLGGPVIWRLTAYEMASILVEKGEEVAFVSMLDTFAWVMPNRSAVTKLDNLFGGKTLEHTMEELFQVSDFNFYHFFCLLYQRKHSMQAYSCFKKTFISFIVRSCTVYLKIV